MFDSEFNELKGKVDYKIENLIDVNTYEQKKIYSSHPFIILPQQNFNLRLESLLPQFVCFIRMRGEQFGDAIAYDLTNCTVKMFLYDSKNQLVLRENMVITNQRLGEVSYSWKNYDLQAIGNYYCEIQIKDQNGKILLLPASQPKIQIIVT